MSKDYLKFGLVFRPSDGETLISGTIIEKSKKIDKESYSIVKKLIESGLNTNERKIIISKQNGKWLSECDPQGIIHVCLIDAEYSNRLGYQFIAECQQKISRVPSYYSQNQRKVEDAFKPEFMELMRKFNDPSSFDQMSRANEKVEDCVVSLEERVRQAEGNTQLFDVRNRLSN